MTDWRPPSPGALDDTPWPEHLLARAVLREDADDRLSGYAVLGDLARHYAYSDTIYLALTGELPNPSSSKLFALGLQAWATPFAGEAPVHLAILTRLSGAPISSALGVGLLAATDQARAIVESHGDLLAWLAAPADTLPVSSTGPNAWTRSLLEAVRQHATDEQHLLREDMTRTAAALALLFSAGMRTPDQLLGAIVAARICGIFAEARATGPEHLSLYPVKVPAYRYVEGDPDRAG